MLISHYPAPEAPLRPHFPKYIVNMSKELIYPVDTANFKWIRERGCVYVDKTSYISKLTKTDKYYFLARPRRFGKSLFLDTLAEYFSGNRYLFKGLDIDSLHPEEWESYSVLRLNMSGTHFLNSRDLTDHLLSQLDIIGEEQGINVNGNSAPSRFGGVIYETYKKTNKRVVILIDEYDAPLSCAIDNPDLQEVYRSQLHGFYSVLKNSEAYIHFCFLTGITRYGKVSVFSGLNNLNDITFSDRYAGICGITEKELHEYYDEGIRHLAQKLNGSEEETYQKVKDEYDGYHFTSSMLDVYNPFSINHLFANEKFDDYWCQSGVPTILSKSLMRNDFDVEKLNGKKVPESEISNLSMFNANPVPLFYQTGYLTIKDFEERRRRYTLGYPNREVETAIMRRSLCIRRPQAD